MSELTTLLSWMHWMQIAAQKVALVGSGLLAGALLYRARFDLPSSEGAGLHAALRAFRDDARPRDGLLALLAGATAIAAALASLSTAGIAWIAGALAEGLAALYIVTELRRTRRALANADPGAEAFARDWLERWRGQNVWLAVNAGWVPWVLAIST